MTRIKKYGYGLGGFFGDVIDDMAYAFNYFPSSSRSYSVIGELVDTSRFDIVPRKEYREELIKQKEEEIEALDRKRESDEKFYTERRKKLLEEKESLIEARDNQNKDD